MDLPDSRTILVADDDDNDMLLLRMAFKKAGREFFRVKNGVEALAYLNGEGDFSDRQKFPYPACLLLDLRMPVLGGLDVIERIRASRQHQNLHVVVSSNTEHDPEVKAALKLGATRFGKPLNPDELIEFLKQCSRAQP